MRDKANPARQGRGIDEGLLMIDYWERRALEDSRAGAAAPNKANFRTPSAWAEDSKMQNKANCQRAKAVLSASRKGGYERSRGLARREKKASLGGALGGSGGALARNKANLVRVD